RGLKSLKKVYVWQTQCTPEGMNKLKLAFSPLEVVGALELKPAVVEEPKAEEPKAEEAKAEEKKADEPKAEAKADDAAKPEEKQAEKKDADAAQNNN
ncbi:MAG: hypothetical protein AB7Q45_17505, partial [Planctomycetaceae bacterium]